MGVEEDRGHARRQTGDRAHTRCFRPASDAQGLDDSPHGHPPGDRRSTARARGADDGDACRQLPADEDAYAFEVKWDGMRAIAYSEPGRLRLETRTLREITPASPSSAGCSASWGRGGRCSTARSSRWTTTAGPASSACRHASTSPPAPRSPAPPKAQPVDLHDLRPALSRRRIADGDADHATRRATAGGSCSSRATPGGAADPGRHRRGRARRQPRSGPRGHRRQAHRLAVQAGLPRPRVAQDQERAAAGVRGRRLHRRQRTAKPTRSARCWSATTPTASCTTPARSAPATPTPTWRCSPTAEAAGAQTLSVRHRNAAQGRDVRQARAGVRVLVRRVDAPGPPAPAELRGPARRQAGADVVREEASE